MEYLYIFNSCNHEYSDTSDFLINKLSTVLKPITKKY